jgi:CIC family chloride channel protein
LSSVKQGKFGARLSNYINRSYLGKWAIVGIFIGLVAGFGATIFYYLIILVTDTVLGHLTGFYPPNPIGELPAPAATNPHYYLIPLSTALGGLICGLIIYKFAPEAEGHGTDAAIDAFHNKGGVIRKRIPLVKMIASAFTIGSGGSAGREGPTAQIAAGFGSIIGDLFKLSVHDRRIAVAAGIGAGIGSIFKSPFGGAILSAEILYSGPDMEAEALIPAFIASPLGYVIFASFTGFTPIFGYTIHYTFNHPLNLLVYAILGVLCAGAGRLYTWTFYATKGFFEHVKISKYLRPMIGGLIVGLIATFFPEVVGLGYGFLQMLIDSNGNLGSIYTPYFTLPIALTLVLIVFFKIFATSVTVGSGGSGGVFAPSLVIGGFVGASLWVVTNGLFPGLIPIPAPLVVIGMMALFAGVGRVPIAVILMVSEMTGSLALIAPSMVAVVISYYLTGQKYTIYRSQVPSRSESPAHRGEYNVPLLSSIKVAEAMNPSVVSFTPEDSVERAYNAMTENKFKGIPIISSKEGEKEEEKEEGSARRKEKGVLVGIVTMSDLARVSREKMGETPLREVMTRNVVLSYPDESLLDALKKMTTNGIGRLPVVSRDGNKVIGIITRTDLFKAYEMRLRELTSYR